jgi:ubiquinone/menaquinone biosynthesis C-methylase UbiE
MNKYTPTNRNFYNVFGQKTYTSLLTRLTFGMNELWKRNIIKILQKKQSNKKFRYILDLGCGIGDLSFRLSKAFPGAQITGGDISEESIEKAQRSAKQKKVTNIQFRNMDAENLEDINPREFDKYDCIVLPHLARYVNLKKVIPSCTDLLTNNGLLLSLDLTIPKNLLIKQGYHLYWRFVQTLLSVLREFDSNNRDFYDFCINDLRQTIGHNNWVTTLLEILSQLKYIDIHTFWQPLEVATIVTATKSARRIY